MNESISNRMPRVTVEYDCRKQRAIKEFSDAYEARRFYAAKDKAGKSRPGRPHQAPAKKVKL